MANAEDRYGTYEAKVLMDGKVLSQTVAGPASGDPETGILTALHVDKRLDCPDAFSIDLAFREGAKIIKVLDEIREGKAIEILMGPPKKLVTIFKGEILYIEPHFRISGKSTITISGYDKSHRLTRGTSSRTWGDGINPTEFPQIFKKVVSSAADASGKSDGLSPTKVQNASAQYTYMPQYNVSDYLFLKSLGGSTTKILDSDTAVDDKQIGFTKIECNKDPVVVIQREAPKAENEVVIHEAHFSLSTIKQVKEVEVRAWDPKKKKEIVGKADSSDYSFGGTPGWKATGQGLYGDQSAGKKLVITDQPVDSIEEANQLAKSIFNQLSMDYCQVDVEIDARPEIKPGDIVEMKDFGDRFSGKYLVVGVSHTMIPPAGDTKTRLKLARNDILKV